MSDSVLEEIRQVSAGGVWDNKPLIPDESWQGESATKPEADTKTAGDKQTIPRTPAQEDKDVLNKVIGNSEVVAALAREVERKLLRNAGRSPHTSIIQQMTSERDGEIRALRDWIISQKETEPAAGKIDTSAQEARMAKLEERIISIEGKIIEIVASSAPDRTKELEMINEAHRIITMQRQEEIGSDQTPSELSRLERRAGELEDEIGKLRSIAKPTSPLPPPPKVTSKNLRKFGKLF